LKHDGLADAGPQNYPSLLLIIWLARALAR
jgi:hypothetical protein